VLAGRKRPQGVLGVQPGGQADVDQVDGGVVVDAGWIGGGGVAELLGEGLQLGRVRPKTTTSLTWGWLWKMWAWAIPNPVPSKPTFMAPSMMSQGPVARLTASWPRHQTTTPALRPGRVLSVRIQRVGSPVGYPGAAREQSVSIDGVSDVQNGL
jgi:hypothetical protein